MMMMMMTEGGFANDNNDGQFCAAPPNISSGGMTIQDPNIGGIDPNNDDNDDDGCHRGRWQKARRGLRASLAGKGGEARWCTANWTIIMMMMILWGLKKG